MSNNSAKPITGQLGVVALAWGLWGALVLLFAAPLALAGSVSWGEALRFGGSFWALWLLFLPAVVLLSLRFPIERSRLLRNAGLYVLGCLLVVGTNRLASRALAHLSPPAQSAPSPGRLPAPTIMKLGPPGALGVFFGLRATLDVLVYWSLVGICQAVMSFRSAQERERRAAELEANLARARLQALRMQINPHFLFNTLNSIATLVYVNPRAADEMLGDLSELLRRSLESMEEQEIPLAQELDFIGIYVSIEQKRFGDRLRVERDVPDELLKALVPALILQPLVENALRHGLEPRRGPGLISLTAKQEGEQLHLVVQDDGRGFSEAEANRPGRRGVGLVNVRARLQGLYGRDHSFSVGRAEPQGCRVDIRFPFHLEPVEVLTDANQAVA